MSDTDTDTPTDAILVPKQAIHLFEKFDPANEDFTSYMERFKYCTTVYQITNTNIQLNYFLSSVRPEVYKKIRTLVAWVTAGGANEWESFNDPQCKATGKRQLGSDVSNSTQQKYDMSSTQCNWQLSRQQAIMSNYKYIHKWSISSSATSSITRHLLRTN